MTLQFRPNTAPKSLMLIIISLFVLTGVATTYGFVTVAVWPEHLARHVGQSMAFFGLLLGVAAVAACFVSQRRTAAVIMWRIAVGLIVLLAIFYVASIGVGKISALLLLTLAAWTLGNWLYLEKHPGADSVRVLLGLGLLAGTMGWTLAFKIHTSNLYICLLLCICIAGAAALTGLLRRALAVARAMSSPPPVGHSFAAIAFTVVAGLVAMPTFVPTVIQDDVSYHLGLAYELARNARYRFDLTGQIWACAPWAHDVLQAILMLVAGEDARGALSLLWQLLFITLGNALLLVLGVQSLPARLLAISVAISQPIWSSLGVSLQSEAPTACVLLALGLLQCRHAQNQGAAYGVLAGLGMALKASNVVFLVPLAVLWFIEKPPVRQICRAVGFGFLVSAASYVFAFVLTGNPLFPLPLFGLPAPEGVTAANPLYTQSLAWNWLYDVQFATQKYNEVYRASAGLMWFFGLPLILLALYQKCTRYLALAMIFGVAALFIQMHYLRYILPGLMVLSLLISAAVYVSYMHARLTKLFQASFAIMVLLQLALQQNSSWAIYDGPLQFAVWKDRAAAEIAFFQDRAPNLLRVRQLAQSAEPTQPMVDIGGVFFAGQAINFSWHNRQSYLDWTGVYYAKPEHQEMMMLHLLEKYQPSHFAFENDLPAPMLRALNQRSVGGAPDSDGRVRIWTLRWPQITPEMQSASAGTLRLSRVNSPIVRVQLVSRCAADEIGLMLQLRYLKNQQLVSTDQIWVRCRKDGADAKPDGATPKLARFGWTTRAHAQADTVEFNVLGKIEGIDSQSWEVLNSDYVAGNYRRKAFAWMKP